MLSSPNAVDGLSVADLLTLFSASSSGTSNVPSVAVTYSISPAGITRVVVNHSLDQSRVGQEATFNASPSFDAMDAVARSSDVPNLNNQGTGKVTFEGGRPGSDTGAGALATASDSALMNIEGAELYLSWNDSEAMD